MRFLNSWAADEPRVLLHFSDAVLAVFTAYIQHGASAEAGGLLLGTVHGDNMLITEATVPTPQDRRLRYLFERLSYGHRAIAWRRWRESKGTVRYLGEWHTHPQDDPRPSGLDRAGWQQLASTRQDRRPLLTVIVGRRSLYVSLAAGDGTLLPMRPIE